ncbi:hypothetical protein TBK1r_32790 [Stieleria magnilauensis]|uniref:Vitamin K-dependent gamma-carboxylase n=2 Tax=Stieleria magnilauensis TaxID=2527963 RepID=A0ABX5XR04_9BACT|nr:hypothetical protein TBK1r_32790 [Planctomycetes bacterium TBK1r]
MAANRFARVWAIGLAVLILVTLPIWIPPWGRDPGFPPVPWIAVPGAEWLAGAVETVALAVLLIGLAAAVYRGADRWCWWGVAAALACLIVLDQHRLQPWAYQSLLYAVLFAGMSWREGRRWVIAIAISIYFYSASGKFDYQFVHTVGHQMVQTLASPIGGVGDATAARLAFALPAGELAIAMALAFPWTRRIGGVCAIAMHVTLIGLLGPWSLSHSLGVLAWNGLLAIQAALLFVVSPRPMEQTDQQVPLPTRHLVRWPIRLAVVAALLLPLTERSGYWDHWTSWALYSPHNSRVEIQIHQSAIDRMPSDVAAFLDDPDGDRWSDLDIGQWSLERRWVPVYPQARYQLELAVQLAERHDLDQAIRVKLKRASDRWTGERQETFLIGVAELKREAERYWLGAVSR